MQVIDALLITLGLDTTDFKKGSKETQQALKKTREEADRHTKEMEARAKLTAAAFGKIKTEILGMLTAALGAGGVAAFVAKITEGDAATGRLATNLGIATKHLSAWENVAANFGSSASDIDSAFRNMRSIATQLNMGGGTPSSLNYLFSSAGLDINEFAALAKSGDLENALKLLQQAVSLSPDKGMAMGWLQQAGFSEQTFNFLREVGPNLERVLSDMEKLNAAGEKDRDLAIERANAWNHLGNVLTNVGRRLLNASGATPFMNWLANLIDPNQPTGPFSWFDRTFGLDHPITLFGSKSAPASAGGVPRGIRNNNPGNLNFAGQAGATLEDGANPRFAKFQTMAQGIAALAAQLQRYSAQGVDTVASIISKYAPPSENNTGAYINAVSKQIGVGAGQHLNLDNIDQLRQMIAAISNMEVGAGKVSMDQINAGLNLYRGRSGNSTEVHIDQVTINTQATDAKGIAKDFADGVANSYAFAAHASVGAQ